MPRFLLLLFTVLLCNSEVVTAAAFQLYEVATPDMGLAGVGNAAVARDAATAYFNPAAMTVLKRNQILVGGQAFYFKTEFRQASNTPIAGDNGGKPTRILPSCGIYFVVEICPRLKFGLSFNSPYISYLHYKRYWAGRFLSQKADLYTLNLNPAIGYKLSSNWSIGGGLSLKYGMLRATEALSPSVYEKKTIKTEGRIKDYFDRAAWGYNLGILWEWDENARIGVAWRSQETHEFKGLPVYSPPEITPNVSATINGVPVFPQLNAEVLSQALIPQNNTITTPATLTVSGYFKLLPRLAIVTQGGSALWHQFRKTIVTSTLASGVVKIHRHWRNTHHAGVGLEFNATCNLLLQGGVAYDSSPVNKYRQAADFPASQQWRYGTGAIYTYNCMRFGFAAEYLHMGNNPVVHNKVFLKGRYKDNNALFCNLTFSRLF